MSDVPPSPLGLSAKIISFTFGGKKFLPSLPTLLAPWSWLLLLPRCLFYSIRFFGSVLHEVFYSFSIALSHTHTLGLAHCFSLSLLPHATKHSHTHTHTQGSCVFAIDAASLMYYPKKRNVCIAYAGLEGPWNGIEMGILAFRFSGPHTHTAHSHTPKARQTMITPSLALILAHSPSISLSGAVSFHPVFPVSLMRAFLWAFCIIHHRQTCLQSVYEYYMGI